MHGQRIVLLLQMMREFVHCESAERTATSNAVQWCLAVQREDVFDGVGRVRIIDALATAAVESSMRRGRMREEVLSPQSRIQLRLQPNQIFPYNRKPSRRGRVAIEGHKLGFLDECRTVSL